MDRVIEAFRNWRPKFKFKTPKFLSSPGLGRRRGGHRRRGKSVERTPTKDNLLEHGDTVSIRRLEGSPRSKSSSDRRSSVCCTTSEEDRSSAGSSWLSSLNLSDLPDSISEVRKAILEVLVDQGLLTHSLAMEIYKHPRDEMHRRSSRTHLLYNFLWLPQHVRMSTCFVDFINFYCDDAEHLDELLMRKLAQREKASVKDLVDIVDEEFYSFCLGRVVNQNDISHCARCRACFDHRYWHCDHCDRCSLGMSIGLCEHCGYRDIAGTSGDSDEASVGSVSEL